MSSTRFDWPDSWTKLLPDDGEIVAIVAAHDFPEPELVIEVIKGGVHRNPTWVMRDRDKLAQVAFDSLAIEPTVATLNPIWKGSIPENDPLGWKPRDFDNRGTMRDCEIVDHCTRVILFCTPQTKTLDFFTDARWTDTVRVMERGQKKAKRYRKGKATA